MRLSRRRLVAGALALPLAAAGARAFAQAATTLKISHQFPGGTSTRAISATASCAFAAEVEKRTNGALKFAIYPARR